MSEASFGPGARRLAGLAGRKLGWRAGEFWAATPAELAAILAPDDAPLTTPLGRADLDRLLEQNDE